MTKVKAYHILKMEKYFDVSNKPKRIMFFTLTKRSETNFLLLFGNQSETNFFNDRIFNRVGIIL